MKTLLILILALLIAKPAIATDAQSKTPIKSPEILDNKTTSQSDIKNAQSEFEKAMNYLNGRGVEKK